MMLHRLRDTERNNSNQGRFTGYEKEKPI